MVYIKSGGGTKPMYKPTIKILFNYKSQNKKCKNMKQ